MRRAVIESIIVFIKMGAAILRHIEIMQKGFRQSHFPFLIVSLMVAHNRYEGNVIHEAARTIEPVFPLMAVFAVVHQVPHVCKEICLRMTLCCALNKSLPIRIIAGLGTRENKCPEIAACVSTQLMPGTFPAACHKTVLICPARLQPCEQSRILLHPHSVVRKACIRWLQAPDILTALQAVLQLHLWLCLFRAPHQAAARAAVCRDELAQFRHSQAGFILRPGRTCEPAAKGSAGCQIAADGSQQNAAGSNSRQECPARKTLQLILVSTRHQEYPLSMLVNIITPLFWIAQSEIFSPNSFPCIY